MILIYLLDIDDCSPNPCQNSGNCTDGLDEYAFTCANGYTGNDCQTSKSFHHFFHIILRYNVIKLIAAIIRILNKHDICCRLLHVKNYKRLNVVILFLLYKIDINECESNPCQNNATCIDKVDSYTCNCPFDWTGSHCEIGNCLET